MQTTLTKQLFIFCCFLFLGHDSVNGQSFERLNYLVKERDFLQKEYERINAQVKASKSKKPSPELQTAYELLMTKDGDIIKEIEVVQAEVTRQKNEIAHAPVKEKIIRVGKTDKAQEHLMDSLLDAIAILNTERDSLVAGTTSINAFRETLDQEVKTTAEEKALIQKELDAVKTDKFILARRNKILLYFNMGVGILLFAALIYTIAGFRRRRLTAGMMAVQEIPSSKPRPITGFSHSVPKIAFESIDIRLDKIEKLGKLREKGLLSEEEFLMQKKQILNSKKD